MLDDIFQLGIVTSILATAVRMGTILLLAALGELVVERAGVLNLSVEGMMLSGAFAGFLGAYYSNSLWIGVLFAIIAGILISAIFGILAVILKIDQTVSGLTVNIFSAGLTFYMYRSIFPNVGATNIPALKPFTVHKIPFLSDIPIIGEILFSQYALSYIAILMMVLITFYLYRTKSGLILRTLGENPRAVDMKGINVTLYRFCAVLFGGMMAGLAGAFITLASVGIFVADITSGRGWLAIAIVIFGDWKPTKILWASLFFGFIDALQMQLQALGVQLPFQLFLAMPYILTTVAVFLARKRSGAPMALGIHYVRE
ncbi:MAG: ABC transporter permease [SAR324 cluster bacterium]|jgi:simple sugar transport system permease protein|nr:ABC transporter permease [SAR324 cluster bacterium]|tara:strand:- start:725 stop:1669 length:945 start_codon:yes stop_codon:yes gene_type:complete